MFNLYFAKIRPITLFLIAYYCFILGISTYIVHTLYSKSNTEQPSKIQKILNLWNQPVPRSKMWLLYHQLTFHQMEIRPEWTKKKICWNFFYCTWIESNVFTYSFGPFELVFKFPYKSSMGLAHPLLSWEFSFKFIEFEGRRKGSQW
jgi:hypothetical protein